MSFVSIPASRVSPLLLLPLLLLLQLVSGQQGEELASIYKETLTLFEVFPPIDPDPEIWTDGTTTPIDVVVGTTILSIDEISPGSSRFTASLRLATYWKKSACNQTETHRAACDTTVNQVRFFSANNIIGNPVVSLRLELEDIHSTVFEDRNQTDIQPDAALSESQQTFAQAFDMQYYPYEIHGLEISATSLYSNNVVNLTIFPTESFVEPSVPQGWDYIGTTCETFTGKRDKQSSATSQDLVFSTYTCTVYVSRDNPGWWTTSFFLHCGIIIMAFAGTVGMMSNSVAEARDDRDAARRALFDGTRLIGTFTMGLLLTYVFQVETSPYGQPVEYWPNIPASTKIYSLGLTTIFIQAFSGLIGSFVFKRPLLSEGFMGIPWQTYDFESIPKEGEVGEDRSPLILRKYDPLPAQSYDEALIAEAVEQPEATKDDKDASQPAAPIRIPRIRKNNMKGYNVLSLGEAKLIQSFVRNVFLFKLGLLFTSFLAATIILVRAKSRRNDVYDDVLASL